MNRALGFFVVVVCGHGFALSHEPRLRAVISQTQNHCPSVQGAEAEHRELQGQEALENSQELDEGLASINPGHAQWQG